MAAQVAAPAASGPTVLHLIHPDNFASDVKIIMDRKGSITELHAHTNILERNAWFQTCLRRQGFKARREGINKVVNVREGEAQVVHLFVKYLYTNTIEEGEALNVSGNIGGMTIATGSNRHTPESQTSLQLLLMYACLWEVGDFFRELPFSGLMRRRFINAAEILKSEDLTWWICWYYNNKSIQWSNGFDLVITAAVLGKQDFMCGTELDKAVEACPALGYAMLREHAEKQEDAMGDDTDALVRFFHEGRRKRAGVFAPYEEQLELYPNEWN